MGAVGSAVTQMQASQLQASMGNAAVSSMVSDQSAEDGAHHLGYNPDYSTGEARDPEQPVGTLPFEQSGGWDANEILSNLTQVDADPLTLTDGIRCAAVSTLAVHVQGGPSSVADVASSIAGQMLAKAATDATVALPVGVAENLEILAPIIASLPDRIQDGSATYQDLQRLSHAMKLLVDSDVSSGTSADEYDALTGLGGALNYYVGQNKTGLGGAQELVDTMLLTENLFNTYFILSVGTNDAEPGSTNHAVNLGIDGSGKVYFYDPWPREGSQLLFWDSDMDEIRLYFETTTGVDRVWRIRELMRPA